MGGTESKHDANQKELEEDLEAAKRVDEVHYLQLASPGGAIGGQKGLSHKHVHHDHKEDHAMVGSDVQSPRRRLNMSAISQAGLGGDVQHWNEVGSPIRVHSDHDEEENDNEQTNPARLHLAVRTHARRIPDEEFLSLHEIQGDIKLLGRWVREHGLRVCDSRGISLLHLAASVRFYEFLLSPTSGMQDMINVRCLRNRTPLHYRCERGSKLEVINYLIEHGAYPTCRDKDFITPIHLAAGANHATVVRLLLERHDVPVDVIDRRCQTLFHEVCWNGCLATLEVLIEFCEKRGMLADLIDKPDDRGVSPLLGACTNGQTAIVKRLLLEDGGKLRSMIDVNRKDVEGDGALNRCTWDGHVDIAKILLGVPVGGTAGEEEEVDEAGTDDDPYASPKLRRRGGYRGSSNSAHKPLVDSVDVRDNAGLTPLHSAVFNHQVKMTELLLDEGASIDAQDHVGDTALHILVEGAADDTMVISLALVRLLCSRGANVYIKSRANYTAPQMAVQLARALEAEDDKQQGTNNVKASSKTAFRIAEFLVRFIKAMAAKRRKNMAEIALRMQAEQKERDAKEAAAEANAAAADGDQKEEGDEGQEQQPDPAAAAAAAGSTQSSPTKKLEESFTVDEDVLERAFAEEAMKHAADTSSSGLNQTATTPPKSLDASSSGQQHHAAIDEDALQAAFDALTWNEAPHSPALGAATALAAMKDGDDTAAAEEIADAVHAEVSHADFANHIEVAAPASPGSPTRRSRGANTAGAADVFNISGASSPLAASAASAMADSSLNNAAPLPNLFAGGAANSNRVALWGAVQGGDLAHVRALLDETPALLSRKDANGATPLMIAAQSSQAPIVSYFLGIDVSGGDVLRMKDKAGRNALHHAVAAAASPNRLDVCKLLVTAQSNLVQAVDNDGNSCLHLAAAQPGTKMLLRFFCLSGADPKLANAAGKTALDVAEANGQTDNVEYLKVVSAFSGAQSL